MTDNSNAAPERIWAWPDNVEDGFMAASRVNEPPTDEYAGGTHTEYTRADLASAQIAAAYEAAALACHKYAWPDDGTYSPDQIDIEAAERATVSVCQDAILALTPADAKTALDAMLKAERAKAYERVIDSLDYLLNDIDQGDAIRATIRALAQEDGE